DWNRVERAEPAFFDEHGDAGADLLAVLAPLTMLLLKFFPTRGFQRLVEQKRIITGIVDDFRTERVEAERVRHRAFADQIAPANFNAVDSNFRSYCIQQTFAHEGGFVAARGAIGAAGRLVGQANMSDCAISRHPI